VQLVPHKALSYEVIDDPARIPQTRGSKVVIYMAVIDGKHEFRCIQNTNPITNKVLHYLDYKVVRVNIGGHISYETDTINVPFFVVGGILSALKNFLRLITKDGGKCLLTSDLSCHSAVIGSVQEEAISSKLDIEIMPVHPTDYESAVIRMYQQFNPATIPAYNKNPRLIQIPAVKYLQSFIRCFIELSLFQKKNRIPDS